MDQEDKKISKNSRPPEKLNDYIRTGSAGGSLLIAGLILLAAALVVWGFVGRIPVTSSQTGVVLQDETGSHTCLCFVDVNDQTDGISEGKPATVTMIDGNTFQGSVRFISDNALSAGELNETFGGREISQSVHLMDWIMENLLGDSKYCYILYIETEEDISEYRNQMVNVTVILTEVQPISYLLK